MRYLKEEKEKRIRSPTKILVNLRFKGMRKFKRIRDEKNILKTLKDYRRQLTPTRVAKFIGIHSVTAKKYMLSLAKKKLLLLKKRGNRNYFKLNRDKFK